MDLALFKENKVYIISGSAVLGGIIAYYGLRRFFLGPRCESTARLHGKVVIITGANTGIGKATAIDLAKRGAIIIAACRSESKGMEAVSEIREKSKNPNVFFKALDLASLQSVKDFAASYQKEYDQLDILVNNAGVMMCPFSKTVDGFEMQFGTNHFGHFALTMLLLDKLKKSNPSRIVNLSSTGHNLVSGIDFDNINSEKNYNSLTAYGRSKLANILFTRELGRKLKYTGVTTYAVHPGGVVTDLARHQLFFRIMAAVLPFAFKTPEYGAQTSIYCAVQEGLEIKSGEYFADCKQKKSSKASYDAEAAKKLWKISEEMTGINYPF